MRRLLLIVVLALAVAAPAAVAAWRNGPYEGRGTKAGPQLKVGKVAFKVRDRRIRAITVRFRARCRYNTAHGGADRPDYFERGVARLLVAVKVKRGGRFDRTADAEVKLRDPDSRAAEPAMRFRGRLTRRGARGRIALGYAKYTDGETLDYAYNCGTIFGGNRFRARR